MLSITLYGAKRRSSGGKRITYTLKFKLARAMLHFYVSKDTDSFNLLYSRILFPLQPAWQLLFRLLLPAFPDLSAEPPDQQAIESIPEKL